MRVGEKSPPVLLPPKLEGHGGDTGGPFGPLAFGEAQPVAPPLERRLRHDPVDDHPLLLGILHDEFRHMRQRPLRQAFGDGAPQFLGRPKPTSEDPLAPKHVGNFRNRCH